MARIWFSAVSFLDLAQQVLHPPRIAAALLGADSGTHPVRCKSHTNDGTMPRETRVTKRILIIDDQRHVLDVLREIVASFQHRHAYEVSAVRSVADAVIIVQREHFDLILLDMVMPGIGDPLLRRQGLDLLRRLRDVGVNAPVIMMSGDLDSRKEADAMIEGAFGYLNKPFDLGELDRLVTRAIESVDRRGPKGM
jgi:DNA-binding NtrC family response regulator